jgi:bifunctional non-homologous end joining protein LigD
MVRTAVGADRAITVGCLASSQRPQRVERGRIFLDFLRNQRTATAILPYSARARSGMPVAAPVTWEELENVGASDSYLIADVEILLQRARSRELKTWGIADQVLPALR